MPRSLLLLSLLTACGHRGAETPTQKSKSGPTSELQVAMARPQPKPGERVRQPELDGYCAEHKRPEAFYYHGGRPVVRLAHQDGCTPLFLIECEPPEECSAPREQEAGMWCCAPLSPDEAQASR